MAQRPYAPRWGKHYPVGGNVGAGVPVVFLNDSGFVVLADTGTADRYFQKSGAFAEGTDVPSAEVEGRLLGGLVSLEDA